MHDTIATSKKCCYGCFLLGEILHEKKEKRFRLYGTHGRVHPWMPPVGLDVDILLALKSRFVEMLNQVIQIKRQSSHKKDYARQSSPPSSDDEESPPKEGRWIIAQYKKIKSSTKK